MKGKPSRYWLRSRFYAGYRYAFQSFLAFKAGLDVIHRINNPHNLLSWGLGLGADLRLDSIMIPARAGRYLLGQGRNPALYWKAGTGYFVSKRVGIYLTLHAHAGGSDFIDIEPAIRF